MKHGVEVHPLPDHVHHQQQARLTESHTESTHDVTETTGFKSKSLKTAPYLEPKLVEEVVDEVFDEADDADVQVLPCDVVEDDAGGGRLQLVPQPEELLVAVDGHLEGQESQHQEVVLQKSRLNELIWTNNGHETLSTTQMIHI